MDTPGNPSVEQVPCTVLVNPVLEPLGDETDDGWEGCPSVHGMRGLVPRCRRLRFRGRELDGSPIDRTVEGFHARVVRHEVDHLDGILYPQRVGDLREFGFGSELIPSGGPLPPD
jgi:peptide deformylase